MGSSKAALDWHGSTLVRRVTGLVARSVDGPVVAVSAPGQRLPELDPAVEVVADAREGRGPLQGLAAGLAAIGDRAQVAYVSSTDVPLLHPAFVRVVVSAFSDGVDVVLPEIAGYRQPLAAGYRIGLLGLVEELIAADRLRPAFLFERCEVVRLSDQAMLRDDAVARLDPELGSVSNLNEPADYERAHALPAPEIWVERFGTLAPRSASPRETVRAWRSASPRETVRAWTLGGVAAAVGLSLDEHVLATLNGDQVSGEAEMPLATGDAVAFRPRPRP
jgi:molybdopterin-guanine dinucleotide biosynthesis protein A